MAELPAHEQGREGRHSGDRAQQIRHRHRHRRVAERRDLQVFAFAAVDDVQPVEGEKDRDLPAFAGRLQGEHEGRVGPVEGAFAGDDGEPGTLGRRQGVRIRSCRWMRGDGRGHGAPSFLAVNSTAFTPYDSAASRVDSFRNAKPGTIVERTRLNPASSSSANISPSGRAPPIQLAQSLGSLTMDCDNCLALTMSAMEMRPPEPSTRNSSRITRRLRNDRLITPLEMTTSMAPSGNGISSIRPSRKSTLASPASRAWASALARISEFRSTPWTRPGGPTCQAAMMLSRPAPLPRSSTTSPACSRLRRCGLPTPANDATAPAGARSSHSGS